MAALRKQVPGIRTAAPAPRKLSIPRKPTVALLPPIADNAPPPVRLARLSSEQTGAAEGFAQPINLSSLAVSSPHDAAEKEASSTASKVVRMSGTGNSTSYAATGTGTVFRLVKGSAHIAPLNIKERGAEFPRSALTLTLAQRSPVAGVIQRQAAAGPTRTSNIAARIQAGKAGGSPLPAGVRSFMEPRFGADFSGVRIHTGDSAARLNRQVSAHAFTTGNHIFFGRNKFKPESDEGKELIAHELTHTIQQGAASQLEPRPLGAQRAESGAAIQRSEAPQIAERQSSKIQRGWLGFDIPSPLDWLAGKANIIPGFRMFTIILGVNPINMTSVDRSAANILRALIEFMPGGALVTEALDNNGVFDKAAAFVEQQVNALGLAGSAIKAAVDQFVDSLDLPGDLLHPGATWERAKSIFTGPIDQLKDFAVGLVTGIIELIKDAILLPIAKLAEGTEGYSLLKAVMGKDPITGDAYPQTAENVIGPFMKLIGQDEIWQNMQKANAVPRAYAWFKTALNELMGFVNEIPGLFVAAFQALELADIILVPRAFAKLAAVFGDFLGRFTSWAGNTIWKLLEIIFDVVSPGAFGYVKKTGAALKSILQNPLPFVGNLVKAAKLGFQNFAGNFLTHLKKGLIDWLTGALPGVYIPKSITLLEVGKFALSVLGITWAQIRAKIVKVLGKNGEKIMAGLEAVFDVVVALVKGGPAAAWEVIKDKLTDLKDQVISGITSFIVETVVTKAVPKLVAMFIPGAGFIPAIISIYDTIMVFVEKIRKIIQVVTAFVDSIVAIAGGAIGAAASRVESVLGGLLSLAISFLAGFVGLGKVADKIMGVINRVRASVDKAIDAAIAWIVAKAKALFAKLFGKDKDKDKDPEKEKKIQAGLQALDGINEQYKEGSTVEQLKGPVAGVKQQHPVFTSLSVQEEKDGLIYDYTASPGKKKKGPIDGNRAYNVDTHTVGKPEGVKMAGESHHVPAKVLQNWIGEILVVAGNATGDSAVKAKGQGMVADKVGTGLSAIWLSTKNHDAAHESSAAKPGDFDTEKNEIIVQTKSGGVSSRPMRTTIAGTVHETAMDSEGSTADTKKKMNKEIYAKFAKRLKSLFTRVHGGLLNTGIAGVENANLKDGKWKSKLRTLAKSSWTDKLDPKA